MKVGFLITARMKSTRLPLKLTKKIMDREIIIWLIERVKCSNALDEIVIATSTNPQDQILCDIAKNEDVKCYRGSEDDVLHRLYDAALNYQIDYILNITADCPLVSFDFFEKVVELYKNTNADLITNMKLPHGMFLYGIKISALKKVLELKGTSDTEIWGQYFQNEKLFKVIDMDIPKKYQRNTYRLTLDYPEDYDFFKAVYNGLGPEIISKSSLEIINFLDSHPEIVKINEHCEEKYKKNFDNQTKMVLK